jgi:hypothetical protein
MGKYRDLLKPTVHIESARGVKTDVPTHQTAPGRYEATVVVDAADALSLNLTGSEASTATRVVLPDLNEEYRLRPADEAGLKAIADATGGLVKPTPDALKNTGTRTSARRALWPGLVILALGFWLGDVWLRRVRLFEGQADEVSRAIPRSA